MLANGVDRYLTRTPTVGFVVWVGWEKGIVRIRIVKDVGFSSHGLDQQAKPKRYVHDFAPTLFSCLSSPFQCTNNRDSKVRQPVTIHGG